MESRKLEKSESRKFRKFRIQIKSENRKQTQNPENLEDQKKIQKNQKTKEKYNLEKIENSEPIKFRKSKKIGSRKFLKNKIKNIWTIQRSQNPENL